MTTTTVSLTKMQRIALCAAINRPGWAKSVEDLTDGGSAVVKLRPQDSVVRAEDTAVEETSLMNYEFLAVRKSLNAGIKDGLFGASAELVKLLALFQIKASREEPADHNEE